MKAVDNLNETLPGKSTAQKPHKMEGAANE
jgi:hypothetical protein